jgi:hypothetical protein
MELKKIDGKLVIVIGQFTYECHPNQQKEFEDFILPDLNFAHNSTRMDDRTLQMDKLLQQGVPINPSRAGQVEIRLYKMINGTKIKPINYAFLLPEKNQKFDGDPFDNKERLLFDPEYKEYLKEYFKTIGFKITEDDGQYGKAECIRTNGMTIISWNRKGHNCTYFGEKLEGNLSCDIKKDGGTRTVFNGYVYTMDQLELIIKLTM